MSYKFVISTKKLQIIHIIIHLVNVKVGILFSLASWEAKKQRI